MKCRTASILFFLLIFPGEILSNEAIPAEIITEGISLSGKSFFLEDSAGNLAVEEIINSQDLQNQFQIIDVNSSGKGFTNSAYWIKFTVSNSENTDKLLFLEYSFPPTDIIEFYSPLKDGAYEKKVGGDAFPFNIREINFINPVFSFTAYPGLNTVYMRIHTTSALNLDMQLHSKNSLVDHVGTTQIWLGIFYGILFIMIFYNLFIYIVIKDHIYFLYAAYIFMGAAFQFSMNGLSFQFLWPNSIWLANNSVTILLGFNLLTAAIFSREFLKLKSYSSFLYILLHIYTALASCGILISFFNYSIAVRFETILVFFLLPSILFSAVYVYIKGLKEARYFLFAWIVFLIGGTLKSLHSNGLIVDNFITSSSYQIGLAWEVTLLSLALADRLSVVKNQMAAALENTYNFQKKQSEELEIEIRKKTEEYNIQKDLLASRKKSVDEELYRALSIQQKLIPKYNPANIVSSLYKPAIGVGGDLFDFITFPNSNKLGIFLCDVAGHGVAAALTTSVIKTLILQAGDKKENPDLFLKYMNESIISEFNFDFITMYYGIFDRAAHEIISCNAGHPLPILVYNDSVSNIQMGKIIPIGIYSNKELESRNINFPLTRTILPENCRVFFYTDGVSECVSQKNHGYFEDKKLSECLLSSQNESCHTIIHKIYHALTDFRGSEHFEDDICMICLEVN